MLENVLSAARYDIGFSDLLMFDFRLKNPTKTIRREKINGVWIPEKNGNFLIDTLQAAGFVCHATHRSFNAISDTAIVNFEVNDSGYHDGQIYYTDKGLLKGIIDNIVNCSDFTRRLEIKWYTDEKGNYENVIDTASYVTKDCIYPFVEGGVEQYVKSFLKSDSSIIILIGEPGTGKTNFIRNILYTMGKETYLSFNENVLKTDGVFVSFVCDDNAGSFVIEDADLLLKSRDIGNETMSKFLNIGDGLVRMNGKKLIFSTNLESINDIDPAIMRPGRCFDALHFRKLTLSEARAVCEEYNLPQIVGTEGKTYSLAEIFNQKIKKHERKFGFI